MTTLLTYAELTAAGYTRGRTIRYRGFRIHPRDISGGHCYGYRYAIGLSPEGALDWEPGAEGPESPLDLTARTFGATESVWLAQEKNSANQLGCFAVCFSPSQWEPGVTAAQAAIDAWLNEHPKALAAVEAFEHEQATTAARQAAKATRRATARGLRVSQAGSACRP